MSIINDAIKKARREFEIKSKKVAGVIIKGERPAKVTPEPSEVKWTAIVVVSLVLITSLLGSLFLYKHMLRLDTPYSSPPMSSSKKRIPVTLGKTRQRTALPSTKVKDVVELNGIVYGPKDKWAIINNRITREGDTIAGGKLILIARDFVKIEKDNGEEIVLELR